MASLEICFSIHNILHTICFDLKLNEFNEYIFNYLFQAINQASKKLTFGIDESHLGQKNPSGPAKSFKIKIIVFINSGIQKIRKSESLW